MSPVTPIVVDTNTISQVLTKVLKNAKGGNLNKNTALNEFARTIAGADKNWGYLTNADQPIFAPHMRGKYVLKRPDEASCDGKRHNPGPNLQTLGYTRSQQQLLDEIMEVPLGLALVSGNAGSGISHTTQQVVKRFLGENIHEIKVIGAIEVEEQIVNGVTYFTDDGSQFSGQNAALWQAVRFSHDTALIWAGEAREFTYVQELLNASMGGYNVIASMRANDAIDILHRLKNMGIEDYKLQDTSLIKGLVSQKLVPTLCPHCKIPVADAIGCINVPHHLRPDCIEALKLCSAPLGLMQTRNPGGCEHCRHGWGGRTAIAEVIRPDQKFMDLLGHGDKDATLEYWKEDQNGISMMTHGFAKVIAGQICPQDLEAKCDLISSLSYRDTLKAMRIADEYM